MNKSFEEDPKFPRLNLSFNRLQAKSLFIILIIIILSEILNFLFKVLLYYLYIPLCKYIMSLNRLLRSSFYNYIIVLQLNFVKHFWT